MSMADIDKAIADINNEISSHIDVLLPRNLSNTVSSAVPVSTRTCLFVYSIN